VGSYEGVYCIGGELHCIEIILSKVSKNWIGGVEFGL
jgi:hypothetical protein